MIKSIYKVSVWLAMLGPLCASAQTSLTDDFNAGSAPGWTGGSFTLTPENGAIKVSGRKTGAWDAISKKFPAINITSSPYVSIKIRAKADFNFAIGLGSGSNLSYPALPVPVTSRSAWADNGVMPSDGFQEYTFNYSGITGGVDLTKVDWINILINPQSSFDNSAAGREFYIDDVKIGTSAQLTPSLSNVPNQGFVVKETGSTAKVVNLRNITDNGSLNKPVTISATSSNTALVPNDKLVASYTASASRKGSLSVTPNDNAIGESVITVKASAEGLADKLMTFKVIVKVNAAPVMDTIANVNLKKGVATKIPLNRVFDGDPDAVQTITVTSTSSNSAAIPNPEVTFDPITGSGYLTVTPAASAANGAASTISVVLKDNGGVAQGGTDTKTYTFEAKAYGEVNKPPFFGVVANQTSQNTTEVHNLTITGVTNGDNGDNNLSFAGVSSDANIIKDITFSPVTNGTSIMSYKTVGLGTATITVTLTDAQGNSNNNGNLNYIRTFTINSVPASAPTFNEQFTQTTVPNGIFPPSQHTVSMDNGALKVYAKFPAETFPGLIVDLPSLGGKTIDISKNPYVKVRVKSATTNNNGIPEDDENSKLTRFMISLWDQDNDAAYGNTGKEVAYPADGQWHEYTFDFSGSFYKDADGQIDSTKIKHLLITFDTRWFQAVEGNYWIDYILMGDAVPVQDIGGKVTGPRIANQTVLKGENPKPVVLTGINDGKGGNNVRFEITNNKPGLVSNVAISNVVGGTATLTYTITPSSLKVDSARIRVVSYNFERANFKRDTVDFYVYSIDTTGTTPATITIDKNQKFQTIEGLGMAFYAGNPVDVVKNVVSDMNFKVFRIFGRLDHIEDVNDNGDPNVLELANFKYDMKTMSDIRTISEATNAKFFYTILSAPFWLKYNKATHAFLGQEGFAGNNRYNASMYDEYAEFCVAIVRGFKAYCGIDLYGISLQNEPEAGVPYESTLVTPEEYMEMIKVVGKRFKDEGIATTIMMPEDVTGNPSWYLGHMEALKNDAEAKQYVGMGAIHIYDRAGINPREGASLVWDQFVTATREAVPSGKLWMTETSGYSFDVWEGEWYTAYSLRTFAPGPLEYGATLYRGFKFGQVSAWTDLGGYENNPNSLIAGVYKSYTKYMNPGTVMVSAVSSDNNILSLAFTHPDNTTTTILLNTGNIPLKAKIVGAPGAYQMHTTMKGASFKDMGVVASGTVILPASSISVLHSTSGNVKPTIDALPNLAAGLDQGAKTVNLAGITDGEAVKSQTLYVTATSADPAIATVSVDYTSPNSTGSLVVTPIKVGTTKVRVLVKDNGGVANGAMDSTFVEFTVNVTLVTGVAKAEQGTIHVFPNPANSQINVSMSAESITELSVADLSGRVLIQQNMASENRSTQIDVSELTKGLYIITAKGKQSVLVTKFYKQ